MKIAIIGAGFTGLSAAYALCKQGHSVTLFEKDHAPGGLAIGYKKKEWEWTLEAYYHHWFTNDDAILSLAKELHFPVLIKRPKTSIFIDGEIYQFDTLLSILTFPKLPLWDKLRMIETLGLLKLNPFWKSMEKVRAAEFLPKAMGEKAYELIWKPQFVNKFGHYADKISLSWFWARIKKRTPHLAYPKGGFLAFAKALEKAINTSGGTILYSSTISSITTASGKVCVQSEKKNYFDKVIVTLPSFPFLKLCPQLPEEYVEKLKKLEGLGALLVVMRLKKQFFTDNTYWLSVCDTTSPLMAIVEHTHFMDKKYYNNEHIVYLGNYLPFDHPYFSMTEKELMEEFNPFLKEINPTYQKNLIDIDVFKAPFAQPIIPTNYSKIMPTFDTPLPNVYLANIQQVYPWDRGTNYAVELGQKIADHILR